ELEVQPRDRGVRELQGRIEAGADEERLSGRECDLLPLQLAGEDPQNEWPSDQVAIDELSRSIRVGRHVRLSVAAFARARKYRGACFIMRAVEKSAAGFEQLGSYLLVRPLGKGGMGVVYIARTDREDRPLAALKRLRPDCARIPSFAERFNHEGELAL